MKKNNIKIIVVGAAVLITMLTLVIAVGAASNDSISNEIAGIETAVGQNSDFNDTDLSIEEMLNYAVQDEFLARTEYEKIIATFGEIRPFTNIIEAEKTHIELLIPLFEEYGYEIPDSQALDNIVIPNSVEEALEIGVEAEIKNIKMYEDFLLENLPDDIKDVFVSLKEASEKHLSAFENGVDRNTRGRGNGR